MRVYFSFFWPRRELKPPKPAQVAQHFVLLLPRFQPPGRQLATSQKYTPAANPLTTEQTLSTLKTCARSPTAPPSACTLGARSPRHPLPLRPGVESFFRFHLCPGAVFRRSSLISSENPAFSASCQLKKGSPNGHLMVTQPSPNGHPMVTQHSPPTRPVRASLPPHPLGRPNPCGLCSPLNRMAPRIMWRPGSGSGAVLDCGVGVLVG